MFSISIMVYSLSQICCKWNNILWGKKKLLKVRFKIILFCLLTGITAIQACNYTITVMRRKNYDGLFIEIWKDVSLYVIHVVSCMPKRFWWAYFGHISRHFIVFTMAKNLEVPVIAPKLNILFNKTFAKMLSVRTQTKKRWSPYFISPKCRFPLPSLLNFQKMSV